MWKKRKRKLSRRKADAAVDECTSSVDSLKVLDSDLRVFLMHAIDLRHGLLDVLRSKGVLTRQQVEVVRNETTETSEISQLLNYVIGRSDAGRTMCLDALRETQQTHVANYLRSHGSREAMYGDDWPVLGDKSWETVDRNWHKLIELIDTRCGLLDELLSIGCIHRRHVESVVAETKNSAKNDCLLSIMHRRSISDFKKFIECLLKTKQHHMACLLSPGSTSPIHAIGVDQNRLQNNQSALIDLIDVNPDLLARLLARDCLTRRQRDFIESTLDSSQKAVNLLDIVRRGSQSDFTRFVECLREAGQEHVCVVLTESGVVALTVATISGPDNVEQCEKKIIEQFTTLFSNSSSERQEQLLCDLLRELRYADVELICMKKGHSIGVYYFCKSSSGLEHLCRLHSAGRLKSYVHELFRMLLDGSESANLRVDTLQWSESNYAHCMRYFYSVLPASKLSMIYQLTPVSAVFSARCQSRCENFEHFPSEVLEMVLLKAAGQLFVTFSKLMPDAGVSAVIALSAVTSSWYHLILGRQYHKRIIKRYFQSFCLPFKCRTRKLASLRVETVEHVRSVAEFNGKLYVACLLSDTIQVFVSRPPFGRLGDIKVRGLQTPVDCAVCADTCQLYIADDGSCYTIWQVNLSCEKEAVRLITVQWPPFSLSVSARRVLIIPHDGDALFLYSDDGSQLCHIELPQYMDALHAVETMHSTYVVSHCYRTTEDTQSEYNSVSEVDVTGRVIRTFSCQHVDTESIRFSRPHYLALDDNNHVIVADFSNRSIVVLASDLQLKLILTSSLDRTPNKLCLSKESKLLFIISSYSPLIEIFKV